MLLQCSYPSASGGFFRLLLPLVLAGWCPGAVEAGGYYGTTYMYDAMMIVAVGICRWFVWAKRESAADDRRRPSIVQSPQNSNLEYTTVESSVVRFVAGQRSERVGRYCALCCGRLYAFYFSFRRQIRSASITTLFSRRFDTFFFACSEVQRTSRCSERTSGQLSTTIGTSGLPPSENEEVVWGATDGILRLMSLVIRGAMCVYFTLK